MYHILYILRFFISDGFVIDGISVENGKMTQLPHFNLQKCKSAKSASLLCFQARSLKLLPIIIEPNDFKVTLSILFKCI